MPLPFGTGELATRLRRALDIRGRIPLAIDEVVVPVSIVNDATTAPYRRSGRTAWVYAQFAPDAGEIVAAAIANPSPVDAVLEQLICHTEAAAAVLVLVGTNFDAAFWATTDPASIEYMKTTEGVEATPTKSQNEVGLFLARASSPTSLIPAGNIFMVRGIPDSVASTRSEVNLTDMDIVIPAGGAVQFNCDTADVAVRFSAKCRYLDDVPRLGE